MIPSTLLRARFRLRELRVNNGSFDNGLGEKVGFYYENHDTNKRLANHSARKYLVQKLKDNNVEDTNIMQISGHKSVQSVRNYSAVSEGKHKRISNVLVGADSDNSRALVPIQTTKPRPTYHEQLQHLQELT